MSKVVICGSRDCPEHNEKLFWALNDLLIDSEGMYVEFDQVVSGGAQGADTFAKYYAERWKSPFIECKADWNKHGKSAGYIRNIEMLQLPYVELVIALWDGKSKGTKHTIDEAIKRGIDVHIICYEKYLEE